VKRDKNNQKENLHPVGCKVPDTLRDEVYTWIDIDGEVVTETWCRKNYRSIVASETIVGQTWTRVSKTPCSLFAKLSRAGDWWKIKTTRKLPGNPIINQSTRTLKAISEIAVTSQIEPVSDLVGWEVKTLSPWKEPQIE
jgi:hypothetical protein